jgi:hypothetical protein
MLISHKLPSDTSAYFIHFKTWHKLPMRVAKDGGVDLILPLSFHVPSLQSEGDSTFPPVDLNHYICTFTYFIFRAVYVVLPIACRIGNTTNMYIFDAIFWLSVVTVPLSESICHSHTEPPLWDGNVYGRRALLPLPLHPPGPS